MAVLRERRILSQRVRRPTGGARKRPRAATDIRSRASRRKAKDAILVLTNVPDNKTASRIAHALIEARLAACVNVLAACKSTYHWKGAIESATEIPLLVKTRAALFDAVEAAIRRLHPYELPEVIAVAVVRGFPDYLKWIAAETTPDVG
jgi:periplasmic divalent cation tolerance protein